MAIFGSFSAVSAQFPKTAGFGAALEYVKRILDESTEERRRLMAVPVGATTKVDLKGGVFSLEEAYFTKPDADVRWEAHRGYVDLQVVVVGNELMEVANLSDLVLVEDLSPARDLQYYSARCPASVLRIGEGDAAVFFPVDGHRPGLAAGASALVRKVVVKIPVDLAGV